MAEHMDPSSKASQGVLSDTAILRYMKKGKVVISPFQRDNLATSSYDVTLGEYYYREKKPKTSSWDHHAPVYNPYDEKEVECVWGAMHVATGHVEGLVNISKADKVIWIDPGETILAHTQEFVGGDVSVTSMMKARSSMGRNFIEVCKCAGWGDVGYFNRWTMEITNNSRYYRIPLVVGRRIAQIVFFDTEGIEGASYNDSGKYQGGKDLAKLQAEWTPQLMLPKMYLDREVRALKNTAARLE